MNDETICGDVAGRPGSGENGIRCGWTGPLLFMSYTRQSFMRSARMIDGQNLYQCTRRCTRRSAHIWPKLSILGHRRDRRRTCDLWLVRTTSYLFNQLKSLKLFNQYCLELPQYVSISRKSVPGSVPGNLLKAMMPWLSEKIK